MAWPEPDEKFVADLAEGQRWAERVGEQLRAAGIPAEVTPMRVRESLEQRHAFADDGDIVVRYPHKWTIVEAKSRRLAFTADPTSFPFSTVIVDAAQAWDEKRGHRLAVVFVSQQTGALLALPVRSRPHWHRELLHKRVDGHDRWYYLAPRRYLVTFASLLDHLHSAAG